jgi:hypothetical protein
MAAVCCAGRIGVVAFVAMKLVWLVMFIYQRYFGGGSRSDSNNGGARGGHHGGAVQRQSTGHFGLDRQPPPVSDLIHHFILLPSIFIYSHSYWYLPLSVHRSPLCPGIHRHPSHSPNGWTTLLDVKPWYSKPSMDFDTGLKYKHGMTLVYA